jgi:hypothetical protein
MRPAAERGAAARRSSEDIRVTLLVPPELLEHVATAVAARLEFSGRRDAPASPWLCGAEQAAAYLSWPVGRVHKYMRQLPHRKVGGRLMFNRHELDDFVDAHPDPSGWSRCSTVVPPRRRPA